MGKQIWKPGNMLYPLPVVLATTADKNGNTNVLTVAWTGTASSDPVMAYISVRPSRYSYYMLEETGEFVINLTNKELVFATDYCGVVSGKDVDKFEKMGLTRLPAQHVCAPLIAESPVSIECRVTEKKPLGVHTMFLAEVLCVHADEKYMDDNGRFDFSKSEPIVYSHGEYYGLGEKMGKFGYSVKKNK